MTETEIRACQERLRAETLAQIVRHKDHLNITREGNDMNLEPWWFSEKRREVEDRFRRDMNQTNCTYERTRKRPAGLLTA